MKKITQLLHEVIEELFRIERGEASFRNKGHTVEIPRLIGAGELGSIRVTENIDLKIRAIADALLEEGKGLEKKFNSNEWRSLVRQVLEIPLISIDIDLTVEDNAEYVEAYLRRELAIRESNRLQLEFSVGCSFLRGAIIHNLSVGPVIIESRSRWVQRKEQEGGLSPVASRRVEKFWSGRKLRPRKSSFDFFTENSVISAIGDCSHVCSVRSDFFGKEIGQERAIKVARLALCSIALIWTSPSKAIEGLNLLSDGPQFTKNIILHARNQKLQVGKYREKLPFGPWISDEDWNALTANNHEYFTAVGRVLDYILDPVKQHSQPNLLNAFSNSLIWLNEGCRENNQQLSVVKHMASLDALASGAKSGGIKKLITSRLGVTESTPIYKNGPTFQKVIDLLYSEGRSRTIHGNSGKLYLDWTDSRHLAEQLSRLTFLACIQWLIANPSVDDPNLLKL